VRRNQAIFRPGNGIHLLSHLAQRQTWLQLHDRLRDWTRIEQERHRSPSEAIVDSQSIKSAAMVSQSVGYEQTHQGRKRFLTVDSLGLVLRVLVTTAECWRTRGWQTSAQASQRWVKASAYHLGRCGFDGEPFMQWVMDVCRWIVQVFTPAANRKVRVAQKTVGGRAHFGWLMGCRRLVRDYELPQTSEHLFI